MARRYCPVCGRDLNSAPHAPGCLQLAREGANGRPGGLGCGLLLSMVLWVALAAIALTLFGAWSWAIDLAHQWLHQLAPGVIK